MPAEGSKPSWGFEEGDSIAAGRVALRSLGGGATHEVYLAWDERLLALVVAKVLRPHLATDPVALEELAREAALLSRLSHPVVVRSFGADLVGERPHVVMEHLEGPHLSSLIRRSGALPLEQLLPLALQIASALHYLAGEGVVHLDVKPRNVIMGAPPRLIDLSLARTVDEARRLTWEAGTDAYMAPEQCVPGSLPIEPTADVWGLGATLFHAAAGYLPFPRDPGFDAADVAKRFPQVELGPLPLPDEVPFPVQEAILACLHPEPENRPTPRELVELLEPAIAGLRTQPVLFRKRPGLR